MKRSIGLLMALLLTGITVSAVAADDEKDSWKELPLYNAVTAGKKDVVEAALASGKNPNMSRPTYGSLLMHATVAKQLAIIKLLLAHGADPKAKGNEALVYAAVNSHSMNILKCLVEAGASLNKSPCSSFENAVVVQAVSQGSPEMLSYLLEHGADPNSTELCDSSALQHAAMRGDVPMLGMLVSAHADIDHRDCNGMTGLMHACARGNLEAAAFLLSHGADPSLIEGHDQNAAGFAARGTGKENETLLVVCAGSRK